MIVCKLMRRFTVFVWVVISVCLQTNIYLVRSKGDLWMFTGHPFCPHTKSVRRKTFYYFTLILFVY